MSDSNDGSGRDGLLGLTSRRFKWVEKTFPEHGKIRREIQSLSELEKAAIENAPVENKSTRRYKLAEMAIMRQRLIIACDVQPNHSPTYSESDIPALGKIDGAVTNWLYEECRSHVGFEAGELEELVKNSELIRGDDSPSDSPAQ